ncbi:MAG: zinc ribbon domain-containing protein [Desulfobulbaceae bacterium]|nr:zinc ribbon domain-containing protein [Desulfobulbaceae bacterium]MCK5404311.1 zinc ribbon domain-containing protein [Desulfobulbaceae bacterium]
MPIYEFKCQDCQKFFEILQSTSSADPVTCKKCGSRNVKKTISASSFRIAGSSSVPAGALSGCSSKSGFS